MAVTKNADGTYAVGGISFSTAEEAFAFDASAKAEPPTPSKATTRSPALVRRPRVQVLEGGGRYIAPISGALVIALVAALYFGPHWTVYRLRAAVDARDATAFSAHVDFPSLREDVKGKLLVKMSSVMQSAQMKDNPFAGLGQMLALGLVNQMVETFVSPAGVMMMMAEGKAIVKKGEPSAPPPLGASKEQAPQYGVRYKDWSTAVLRAKDASAAGAFVLKRQGLFSWKLAAIELPS